MVLNRNEMILVLNREAMAAPSRGREPTVGRFQMFLSRECGGSTARLSYMLPPHSRLGKLVCSESVGLRPRLGAAIATRLKTGANRWKQLDEGNEKSSLLKTR